MITEEEYLKALEVVKAYRHVPFDEMREAFVSYLGKNGLKLTSKSTVFYIQVDMGDHNYAGFSEKYITEWYYKQ